MNILLIVSVQSCSLNDYITLMNKYSVTIKKVLNMIRVSKDILICLGLEILIKITMCK